MGVAQWPIIGVVLFMLYVNDLLSVPKKCEAMGNVDDTKLLLALPFSDLKFAISDLYSDLCTVTKWCSTNSLLINPDGTKLLIVGVPQLMQSLSLPPIILIGKKHQAHYCCKRLDTDVTFDDHYIQTVLGLPV